MKNQKVVISRMEKMIKKAKKRGVEPKKKYIEALEKAEKNLRQTETLNEVLNIPRDAAAEVGGNTGGEKISEIINDSKKKNLKSEVEE